MADVRVSDVIASLDSIKFNPVQVQRMSLDVLRKVYNGEINIVDATNPYVHCLETTAFNCTAFIIQNEATTRRLYPAAALTMEDLHLHMSDKEYPNLHATPSKAIFKILLNKAELLGKMIAEPGTGIKKIRIPRNSVFYASDIPFSLQYPIDIKQPLHGGIQISYVTDKISPLKTLVTNSIDWVELRNPEGVSFIQFEVEVDQFYVDQRTNDINNVSGFTTEIPLTDQYYHLRCYKQNSDNSYTEIDVSHTAQVYDPFKVTAIVKIYDSKVEVTIPGIYTISGMISGKIKMDLYQTKGPLTISLGSYRAEDFTADWINLDESDDNIYTTPISNFRSIVTYSTTNVSGGTNPSTFSQLKERVVRNTIGTGAVPITSVQLEDALFDAGYEIIKNVDTVTNRIYLASRALPAPIDTASSTAASASISKLQIVMTEAANIYGAYDNNKRITLSSKVLYKNRNGITTALTESEFNALDTLPVLQKCIDVTNGNYFFSPFTYVLDSTLSTFETRAYFLDSPTINTKSFVADNPTTVMQVSIDTSYAISKNDSGYVIDIVTKSSDNFKELDDAKVHCVLSFYPTGQSEKVYITGVLKGKTSSNERLFSFSLNTRFDIDKDDKIIFTNTSGASSAVDISIPLNNRYDVYFCTTADKPTGWAYSTLDDEILSFDLPSNAYAITNEKLYVTLGNRLKGLWVQSRSNVTSVPYQVYQTDVPATYKNDVYEVDPVTGAAFTIDGSGNLVYNLLHSRGDPVLDSNSNPVYEHLKGEIIYDEYNQPVPMPGYTRNLIRLIDILTIESAYYFAIPVDYNAPNNYRTYMTKSMVNWIITDIPGFNERLLEQTEIYFYPKVAIGDIEVLNGSNEIVKISATQAFKVILHVSPTVYADTALLQALREITIKTIDKTLEQKTISISTMERDLLVAYGDDVVSAALTIIGGADKHNTITLINSANRCSIRKRLSTLPNNSLVVEDDVAIEFVKHGLN